MKIRLNIILLILLLVSKVVCSQTPNNIILPAFDTYTMEVKYDNGYRLDSVVYSNGAVFHYTYDTLGNRFTSMDIPAPPKAELRILFDSIPDTLGRGINAIFLTDWRNSGPIQASNFQEQAFWSIDSILDAGDVSAGITPYPNALPSTFTEAVATHINVPASLTSGQWYWLFLFIDDLDSVVEYSDTNNIYVTKVYIEDCALAPMLTPTIEPQVCDIDNGSITLSLPNRRKQEGNG